MGNGLSSLGTFRWWLGGARLGAVLVAADQMETEGTADG